MGCERPKSSHSPATLWSGCLPNGCSSKCSTMSDSTVLLTTRSAVTFFVNSCIRHVTLTASPMTVNSIRCGEPMFAGHHCAVIERDADPKLRPPFGAPGCVQAGQFLAHGERGTNGRDCVLCRAGAAHISPDRHDGVAHEFVE